MGTLSTPDDDDLFDVGAKRISRRSLVFQERVMNAELNFNFSVLKSAIYVRRFDEFVVLVNAERNSFM